MHGHSKCLPPIDDKLGEESMTWNRSCRQYAPFKPNTHRIATVSASFGDLHDFVGRAYRTHMLHSLVQGDDMHVMCDPIVESMWNKQAFLLKLLYEQMLLLEENRYDWLFWADRDTLLLDHCRPTSSFLPPGKSSRGDAEEIHLIAAEDGNGLNAGVFFIRVSNWSIYFLESVLAYRHYRPEINLRFSEQSAMADLLKTPEFSAGKVYVPWHWFNAYPNSDDGHGPQGYEMNDNEEGLREFQARRGDFLVHFAGDWKKDEPMGEWEEKIAEMKNPWEQKRIQRDVSVEVKKFWEEKGYSYD
ncbi:galactosyl transferase GMA12/MNN10 family protein [Massarina eburnea CBS 473.64]|uniref:Galactosyl transferase GMA12/MNN10 family protein n=1 Tax=Massarina eburnea CBS 473.64 TaxID=1395130 RepID=A0A6A6RJJ4_9PLEO|nr:galactosyl transferase GMA12/MNN10 family protein [Massarina eburnea CBS 473.64]